MATYRGDKLTPGDDAEAHFAQIRNIMATTHHFCHPGDHATIALRNQLNVEAGSKAIAFAMSTVENDLMLDAKLKNHATLADDDNQLQCQDHAIPDIAPEQFVRFQDATLPQIEAYFRRKNAEGATIDTLITDIEMQDFEPEIEDVAVWFAKRCREFRTVRAPMLAREWYVILAKLLPGDTDYHPTIDKMRRPPKSLQEVMEDMGTASQAEAKRRLIAAQSTLQKKAKDLKIAKSQWWKDAEPSKSRRKTQTDVNNIEFDDEPESELSAVCKRLSGLENSLSTLAAAVTAGPPAPPALTPDQKRVNELEEQMAAMQLQQQQQPNQNQNQQQQQNQNQQWGNRNRGNVGGGGRGRGQPQYQQQFRQQRPVQRPGAPGYAGCDICGGQDHFWSMCPRNPQAGHHQNGMGPIGRPFRPQQQQQQQQGFAPPPQQFNQQPQQQHQQMPAPAPTGANAQQLQATQATQYRIPQAASPQQQQQQQPLAINYVGGKQSDMRIMQHPNSHILNGLYSVQEQTGNGWTTIATKASFNEAAISQEGHAACSGDSCEQQAVHQRSEQQGAMQHRVPQVTQAERESCAATSVSHVEHVDQNSIDSSTRIHVMESHDSIQSMSDASNALVTLPAVSEEQPYVKGDVIRTSVMHDMHDIERGETHPHRHSHT